MKGAAEWTRTDTQRRTSGDEGDIREEQRGSHTSYNSRNVNERKRAGGRGVGNVCGSRSSRGHTHGTDK